MWRRKPSRSLGFASTQELLADMYKHASDEEREGLAKAWCDGREKREDNARKKRIEAGWE